MKRLNVKLLLILVITVVVLSTGIAVVHAIQMNRNSDSLLKRAEAAKSSDDKTQAIFYYRRYLSYKPEDLERYGEYAMLTAAVAETPGATGQEYGTAIRELQNTLLKDRASRDTHLNDKIRSEVRHKLIDLEIATRQTSLMAAARTLLLEMKAKKETDAKDDLNLARCQSALGNYSESTKLLEGLLGYNPETKTFETDKALLPNEVEAYMQLALLLREKISDSEMPDRQEIADKVINQMIATNKDSVKALLGQAKYLQQYQSRADAQAAVEKAIKLSPNDIDALLQAAEMASQAKDYASAENLYKQGIANHVKDDRLYLGLALIASVQGKPAQAKERLEAGLKEFPTSPILLQMLFDIQLSEHDAESARVTLQKLGATKYSTLLKEYREAQLLLLEGNPLEASRRLEKLRSQFAKPGGERQTDYVMQADYMLMQCYQMLGFYDLALAAARRLAAENRNIFEAQFGIAAALLSLGKLEEAKAEYEKLLQFASQSDQQKTLPQICNALVRIRVLEQMRLPAESRDWKSVEEFVADLRQRGLVKEPTATLMQADVLAHKGNSAEASRLLEDLAKQFPEDVMVLNARIEIALQDRNSDEAIRIIDAAPAKLRSVTLELAKIDAILQRDSSKDDMLKSLDTMTAKIDEQKMSDSDKAKMYTGMGAAYLRLGETEKSQKQWNKATALLPHDSQLRWMLFDSYRDSLQTEGLKELVDWFAQEYGRESAQAKLTEAAMLVSGVRSEQRSRSSGSSQLELSDANKRDLQSARDVLRAVETLRPEWYERPRILAEIDVLEGKPDEAITDLREELRLGPSNPTEVRRLAQLLLMQKRYAEVKEVLETFGSKGNKGMERIEAVTDQRSGRPDLALQRLESVIPKDSQNPNDRLYHGQLLMSVGKKEQAEAEFRKATELGPAQPETWLALTYFLQTTGRHEEARKTVQQAQIALPEDKRTLAIAQGYEIIGDQQLADQFYQQALAAALTDPKTCYVVGLYYVRSQRMDLAKPIVDELLGLKPKTDAERGILSWARRSKSQMLAAEGGYANFQKALAFLTPPAGEKATAADLSMRAMLLGSRTDITSAREALTTLQELKEQRPLTTNERMLLSQVYERTGDWSAARDEMVSLLGQADANETTLAVFIEMLLRRGTPDDALSWLQKLETASNKSPLLVATVAAHVYAQQGKNAQAVARMMRLVPSERPVPKDKVETLRMVAELLGQLDQPEQSEKLWREYVEANPAQTLNLAAILAKNGKVDEALQMVEQRRKTDPPAMVLKVAAAAARQRVHPLTPDQAQKVEQILQRGMRDDPDSIALKIMWGDFLDSQARYAELEKTYREILTRTDLPKKDRAGVQNNLAFTMALQDHELDEAMKLSEETIAYLGPVAEALDTRGVVYLAKGDTKKAIRDLSDAVMVLDPQAVTYVHLAMAQAAAKDMSSARKSLAKAKELKLNLDDLSPLDRKKFEALDAQLNKPS